MSARDPAKYLEAPAVSAIGPGTDDARGLAGTGSDATASARTRTRLPSSRMFAALNATNEAILRARSPAELFEQFCAAIVHGGEFLSAAVLIVEPGASWATLAAMTCASGQNVRPRISIDASEPEGRGLVGTAFRSRHACSSTDFLHDPRTAPWHDMARAKGVASAAALPLVLEERVLGVLLFFARERRAFTKQVIAWLQRMTDNAAFAIGNFERESARRTADQALRDSEGRFRCLVELASDWYWEADTELRLVRLEGHATGARRDKSDPRLGLRLWEQDGVVTQAEDFARLRTALEQHESFRDLSYALRDHKGQFRYLSVSAEPMFGSDGVFAGYRGTSREVTTRQRAESLVALEHAVTRSLAEADTSRRVLQAVMRVICESEQWETAGYFRIEDEAGSSRLVVGWSGPGMGADASKYYKATIDTVIPPGGLISRVAASGAPIWISDMKTSDTTWKQRVERTGERATFSFPVLSDGKVIGVLAFSSRSIREPDAPLLQTIRVIGEQVGQFLRRKQAEQVLRESEARFRALTDLSADWYWETDATHRYVRIEGRYVEGGESLAGEDVRGRCRWETGLEIEGGWDAHRTLVDSHMPFRDAIMSRTMPDGTRRYISVSGEPMRNQAGAFAGYRGVGSDVTA